MRALTKPTVDAIRRRDSVVRFGGASFFLKTGGFSTRNRSVLVFRHLSQLRCLRNYEDHTWAQQRLHL